MSGVEPAGWNETWRYLAAGLCAALGTYRVLSHVLEQTTYELEYSQQSGKKRSRRNAWYGGVPGTQTLPAACQELLNSRSVNFDSISQLALKSDHRLRKAAAELLYDNAMRAEMLALIVRTASDVSGGDMRLRAVTLIRQIALTSTRRRAKIARAGGISALVEGLRGGDHELALRSGWALIEFLGTQDAKLAKRFRRKAASCGLLEAVYGILESLGEEEERAAAESSSGGMAVAQATRDLSLLGICCNITKVYALRSAFHKQMVDLGYLPVLLCVARGAVGSVEYMRMVMESIVRLCTYLSAYKAEDASYAANPRMAGLLDLGAVEVIAACVRQDDQSVSSWGIGLLHEFVSRGVGKQQLAASPRIVQWLCRKLSTTKYAYTNQLILRSLWCLSTTSRAALVDASQPANLRRILNMFAGGSGNDTESHYWSIALVSRVAVYPATHVWILGSPLPRALRGLLEGLVPNLRVTLYPEVANIISRMCHSITLAPALSTHPEIAETCRMLLGTDIETAQMATIMAIINATASSRAFLATLVDDGVRGRLFELLLDFRREAVQPYAAKCLVALMYGGFLDAEHVVARGLLPFLGELCDKYRALLGSVFMPGAEDDGDDGERDEASAWLAKRLLQSMSTASVLLSALQVYLAEPELHCLEGELAADAVAAMGAFQMCLLAQVATYLMQVLDLGKTTHEYANDAAEAHEDEGPGEGVLAALRSPPASHCGRAEWARVAVNCLVAAYYLHSPGDAHARAAAEDIKRVVCANTPSPEDGGGWDDRGRRRLSRLVADEPEDGPGPGFAGDMRSARVRCVLPILRATLAALADSLEPKLMVQAPGVTRRALWLARIVCHEFPTLRAVAMRLLSVIDARSLPSADAAGAARLCCAFLADSLAGARGLPVDAEQQDARRSIRELTAVVAQVSGPGSESVAPDDVSVVARETADQGAEPEWREWRRNLVGIGVAPEGARQPSEYYELYPELEPGAMALEGWFHARYAVDRRVFGWESCIEHYSCMAPPLVAAAQGSDCWIIDRSGPRGPALQRAAVEITESAPAGSVDDVAQQPAERAAAEISAEAEIAADTLPHSQPGHPSHTRAASVDGGRRRPNRPESPFPATIFPDPSVDAVGEAAAALARPLRTLSPPKVVYYNQAPYFPSFVSLGDGCTLWNSSWKFESARMRTGIDGARGGVHRFEVQLLTSGLVQVGWCTELCGFFPESGEGVGDDFESVAYDGYRQRKWHGTAEEKEYGEKWRAGDVIGAELDLDAGRVVFYRNGKSLGVAFGVNGEGGLEGEACGFTGLRRDRTWYPAFSMASDQGLVFLGASINNSSHEASCADDGTGGSATVSDAGGSAAVSDAGGCDETKNEPIATMVRGLRALGVLKAFKMRVEFQDLDTFPCVALSLPADKGQITVGPLTNAEHLSTYLQPQWWAVWTHHPMSVREASAPDLAAWFAACVEDTDVMSAMLTGNVASWIYFAVLADGRVCVAAGDEAPVVFDVGRDAAGDNAHVWLPVVSPAVVSFDVRVICA